MAADLPQTATQGSNGKSPDRVGIIPLSKIRENAVALRPVNKESEEYQNLADSVKKRGVMIPILVREFQNPDNKNEVLYGLIDGLQRYNAALDAGLTEIKAAITEMDQAEIEEAQIVANAQKIETKPIQYARQIERLLARNPTLTVNELAGRLSTTAGWLYKMLGMNKNLHPDLKELVDNQQMALTNAIELAKLPQDEQPTWSDKAMTMDGGEFTANVAARVKAIKEARKKGRAETPPTFEPVPHGRPLKELKMEFNTHANRDSMINRHKATTPQAGWDLAIAWSVNMDPDSQAQQRMDNEAKEAKRKEEAESKKLERSRQREVEAQKTRAELEAKIAQRGGAPATV